VLPGHALPDFDLPALGGGRITRAGLRGKVALLDFWATWCVPCRAELPGMQEVYAAHKGDGFTIVSIASEDRAEKVRGFRASMPWSHVVLSADDDEEVRKRFEVPGLPSPILVDGEGIILAVGDDLRGEGLRRAVEAALRARR
jgi:thiol-disulfide isomerase/thioredoxin